MQTPEYVPLKDSDGSFAAYAWPGGYPVYHLCADGGILCQRCANDPRNPVGNGEPDWTIIASDVNWEDDSLYCEHCNTRIESAYAED